MSEEVKWVIAIGRDDRLLPIVQDAARAAYSTSTFQMLSEVEEALKHLERTEPGLVVLVKPSPESYGRMSGAKNEFEELRWPVAILAELSPGDKNGTIGPDEWNPVALARVFRATVKEHAPIVTYPHRHSDRLDSGGSNQSSGSSSLHRCLAGRSVIRFPGS